MHDMSEYPTPPQKKYIPGIEYIYKVPLRDVGDVKSSGCCKLEKETQEKRVM